jgi:hypothetical protein
MGKMLRTVLGGKFDLFVYENGGDGTPVYEKPFDVLSDASEKARELTRVFTDWRATVRDNTGDKYVFYNFEEGAWVD